ncbi:hypothetical protein BZM26_34950 [Paraburkholderia strydomiana]|nr:hypothetical protein BZM26_34950 [Paraburkholderia strydomiana]
MAKVLFVDDHRDTADSLSDLANAFGHQASVAYDGATALRLTSEESYDIIFLDVSLRDADGRDICAQIRSGARISPRIIGLTGYTDIVELSEHAFDDCALKPLGIDDLQRLLD